MKKSKVSLIIFGLTAALLTGCENKPQADPEVAQKTAPEKVELEIAQETPPVKVELEIAQETAAKKYEPTFTQKIDLAFGELTSEGREQLSKVLDEYEARASIALEGIEDLQKQIFEMRTEVSSFSSKQLSTVYLLSGTGVAVLIYLVFKFEQLRKRVSCVNLFDFSTRGRAPELTALYKKIDSLIIKAKKSTKPLNHNHYKFVGEHVKDMEIKTITELERQVGKFSRKSYLGALVTGAGVIVGWIMLYQHRGVTILIKREEVEDMKTFLETKTERYKKTMEVVDQIRMRLSLPQSTLQKTNEESKDNVLNSSKAWQAEKVLR